MLFVRVILGLVAMTFAVHARADSWPEVAKQREETIRSATFEIDVVEFVAKGTREAELGPKDKVKRPPAPAADIEVRSRNRLVFDGKKVRYENNHPSWSGSTNEFLKATSVMVTDGTISKSYFPSGISGVSKPKGIIDGNAPMDIRTLRLTPLNVHCRGLTRTITPYVVTDLKRTEGVLTIGDRRCREYSHSPSPSNVISLFVDEDAQFVVRRIRKVERGKLYYQSDITYKHEPIGLIPSSWVITEYNLAGKVMTRWDVTVTAFVANPTLPSEQFDLTFPEGSDVYDRRTRKEYVVKPSGMMSELDYFGNEVGVETPQPGASWFERNRFVLIGVAVAVVLGLVVVWFRVVRRRKSSEPAPL